MIIADQWTHSKEEESVGGGDDELLGWESVERRTTAARFEIEKMIYGLWEEKRVEREKGDKKNLQHSNCRSFVEQTQFFADKTIHFRETIESKVAHCIQISSNFLDFPIVIIFREQVGRRTSVDFFFQNCFSKKEKMLKSERKEVICGLGVVDETKSAGFRLLVIFPIKILSKVLVWQR